MHTTPSFLVQRLSGLITSLEFGGGVACAGRQSLGLTIQLSSPVAEDVFKDLRFELMIPLVDADRIKDDSHYSRIAFEADEVLDLSGSKQLYLLRLVPIEQAIKDGNGKTAMVRDWIGFTTLRDSMTRTDHPHVRGAKLEWRNGFSATRIRHVRHPDVCASIPNPLHVEVTDTRLSSGVAALLPGGPLGRSYEDEVDAQIASLDDGFAEYVAPAPAPPSWEAIQIVELTDDLSLEFVLDEDLLVEEPDEIVLPTGILDIMHGLDDLSAQLTRTRLAA